jgi:23S rRNA (pseudouridine1915-N3)-methyltransferase
MQVAVIAVGKIRESYWREALAEYVKRLSAYVQLDMVEVADEPCPEKISNAEREKVLGVESDRILRHLRDRDAVILLDIAGQPWSSEEWSGQFAELSASGYGRLVFVIGGSLGVHADVRKRATLRWSLGRVTLPHAMARVVLLEQLYRGIRILRGEPYHK